MFPSLRFSAPLCSLIPVSRGILASVFAEVYRVQLLTEPADELWVQAEQLICVYASPKKYAATMSGLTLLIVTPVVFARIGWRS